MWPALCLSGLALAAGAPQLQAAFSLWQWSSPVVAPDAPEIPSVQFASVWHYDGANKRLLLRTGSPEGSSFVLHRGDVSPARMYFFDTSRKSCSGIDLPIGPPRPDWLGGPNGTLVASNVYIKTDSGSFVRTELWCKPDVPGWVPFCSYWAGNTLLRLTAPPGGPGVPENKMILNEYTRYTPGPQEPSLFQVPEFCSHASPPPTYAAWRALPFPYGYDGAEVARALQVTPALHFVGSTAAQVAETLNAHLTRVAGKVVVPCEYLSLNSLDRLRDQMLPLLGQEYDAVYAAAHDRRRLRAGDRTAERAAEGAFAELRQPGCVPDPTTAAVLAAVRAGKCAELVMYYIHHLPPARRSAWTDPLPALPSEGLRPFPAVPEGHPLRSAVEVLRQRYAEQASCLTCHFKPGPSVDVQ